MTAAGIPRVTATLSASGRQLIVRCPFCKRRHFFGYGDAGDGGLRLSHCVDVDKHTYDLVVEAGQASRRGAPRREIGEAFYGSDAA